MTNQPTDLPPVGQPWQTPKLVLLSSVLDNVAASAGPEFDFAEGFSTSGAPSPT